MHNANIETCAADAGQAKTCTASCPRMLRAGFEPAPPPRKGGILVRAIPELQGEILLSNNLNLFWEHYE